MTREEIEIQIGPDGKIQYTIKGVKGSACESISQILEQIGDVEQEQTTSEYYDLEDDAHVSIGNG